MRIRRRGALGALLLAGVTSCVAPPVPPVPPAQVALPPATPAPLPVPRPTIAAADTLRLDGAPQQGALIAGSVAAGGCAVTLTLDGQAVPVARDGRFVVGFDRDAPPTLRLEERRACAQTETVASRTLAVAPRAWRIERLDRVAKVPVPSADFQRRRPAELAQINAARRVAGTAEGWRQRFVWPATGRISGLFGSQRIYRGEPGSYHSGVDVAKPTGAPVVAPADGIVTLAAASPFTLEGNLLMIDHGMGLNSAFLHLSRIDVAVGERVTQGEQVGLVGATGRASGPHLHWSVKWHNARIDPLLVAGPMPPR